mmetsp:Transcript_56369/g.119825  ORF Transcript_56369/g.119825 Transcript_56369/m.119825 type:complete len:94 (-) Transcript_56369:73-354(-)
MAWDAPWDAGWVRWRLYLLVTSSSPSSPSAIRRIDDDDNRCEVLDGAHLAEGENAPQSGSVVAIAIEETTAVTNRMFTGVLSAYKGRMMWNET